MNKFERNISKKIIDQSTLILVMGVPASGKTIIAKRILDKISAVYLDNNFIADAFFQNTRTDPEYVKLRPQLYNVLYNDLDLNKKYINKEVIEDSLRTEAYVLWKNQKNKNSNGKKSSKKKEKTFLYQVCSRAGYVC